MHVRRRQSWVTADHPRPLMPCADSLWLVEAPLRLAQLTGVDVNLIPESRVSVVAVPLGEDDWAERGLRRWVGTRPEAMWHPLLWLPARLAMPLVALTPDGEIFEEPLEQWQTRVAVELVDSQLLTADGWVDVLALVGLDVDDLADVRRVGDWLAGGADEVLDAVDLEPFLVNNSADDPVEDPVDGTASRAQRSGGVARSADWASALAVTAAPLLVSSGRALMADSLVALAFEFTGRSSVRG